MLVPEEEELSSTSLKRRRSSLSDSEAKRQRLDHNDGSVKADETAPSGSTKEDPDTKSRGVHQAEERKRGRRLFGALLGTLSQSSSSTAQKRRTEIERKQQAKLRQQAEEQDEAKREKLQALTAARTKEQKLFSKQSVCSPSHGQRPSHLMCGANRRLILRPDEDPPFESIGGSTISTHHLSAENRMLDIRESLRNEYC